MTQQQKGHVYLFCPKVITAECPAGNPCWGNFFQGSSLSPNETSCTRTELHLIEFLAKQISWELPKQPKQCSPQTDSKTPLLKKTSTQLIEQRSQAGAFTPVFLCLWYRKVLCMLPKDIHKHEASHKPFVLQWCPACMMYLAARAVVVESLRE